MKNDWISHFENLVGEKNLELFSKKIITIVGLGGVGQPVLMSLIHCGFENFILIEPDVVQISNLNRQFMFEKSDVGEAKLSVIAQKLKHYDLKLILSQESFDPAKNLKTDILIDCTDNNLTRETINAYAVKKKIPLLYVSAASWSGQTGFFLPGKGCLKCIFPQLDGDECGGVSITTTQGIASLAVNELMQTLIHENKDRNFLILDTQENELRKIRIKKNPDCLCPDKI